MVKFFLRLRVGFKLPSFNIMKCPDFSDMIVQRLYYITYRSGGSLNIVFLYQTIGTVVLCNHLKFRKIQVQFKLSVIHVLQQQRKQAKGYKAFSSHNHCNTVQFQIQWYGDSFSCIGITGNHFYTLQYFIFITFKAESLLKLKSLNTCTKPTVCVLR